MAYLEYSLVGGSDARHPPSGFRALLAPRGRIVMVLTMLMGSLMSYMYFFAATPRIPLFSAGPSTPTLPTSNLHLLIPASHPDVNLCKVMLSAAVLGYPSPVIVNWNTSFNIDGMVDGGSHLAKIFGVNEYLSHLNSTYDEDLVLMVDAYDIWMQLRPQVLLDRYFEINRRADRRIRSELGHAATTNGIRQEIIFGCQKRCWPWSAKDPACYAVPNSTLPVDIFGSYTDQRNRDKANTYVNYRPRFFNSGVGIGTVRAMRKLFNQAFQQAKYESNFGSDQYIFSHIFGDQEVWREVVRRKDTPNTNETLAIQKDRPHFNPMHLKNVEAKAANHRDKNFEFGLGVDYGSEIVLNTVFKENDTDWLVFNNHNQLLEAQRNRHIDGQHQRSNVLSKDIALAEPPFSMLSNDDAAHAETWQDVPLLTDVWTGITPAVIHHNAHRGGLKSLRETWWPLVWFQKRARVLLTAYMGAPAAPLAISGYDASSQREWWPYEAKKGGARNGLAGVRRTDGMWISFDNTCRMYQEELFRDGVEESELAG